MLNSQTNLTT